MDTSSRLVSGRSRSGGKALVRCAIDARYGCGSSELWVDDCGVFPHLCVTKLGLYDLLSPRGPQVSIYVPPTSHTFI